MKIAELLRQKDAKVITCNVGNTVGEAAKIIAQYSVGALPVIDLRNDSLMGIISERDIVRAIADNGTETVEKSVIDLMTQEVTIIESDDLLSEAMRTMVHSTIRHLPVVKEGKLLGVISQRDVLKAVLDNTVGFIFGDLPDTRK